MSDGIKAWHEDQEDCEYMVERAGLAWSDLTRDEKSAVNNGDKSRLEKLITERTGVAQLDAVQKCQRLLEEHGLTSMDLSLEERYMVNNGLVGKLSSALARRQPQHDQRVPPSAELMFDDNEFAVHFDKTTSIIYVTDSLGDEALSDSVDEGIESMLRMQIKVLDNMTSVLEEMRAELVRAL